MNPQCSIDRIPQKLLNYMAVGASIVSFAGSARNIVDNENGLVVPDGNTEMFANALDTLLNDQELALKLGNTARIGAKRAGTWMDVAKKLESVFSGLMPKEVTRTRAEGIDGS